MSKPLYRYRHQLDRQRWAALVASGTVRCSRYGEFHDCPGLIPPDAAWDLDHINGTTHPAHSHCNRKAGAIKGNKARHTMPRSVNW